LKNNQLDQNTLVFFTSDNGPWIIKDLEGGSAGLFRDGKGSTWEGGMRVPAIAWWPGQIPAGSVNQTPVSAIDLFATFNNLAGAKPDEDHFVDGEALSSVFLDNETEDNGRFLFYYGLGNELMAVRRGPWKLHIKTYSQTGIDYFDGQLPLLFNLNEDPSETQNVADQHPELVRQLQLAIEEHKAEVKQQASFFDQ
jgi:arylsulfatase A